jgi:hypothetical protein
MRPVTFVTRVTAGFTVVISMGARIISGYLITHASNSKRRKIMKIRVVPLRINLRGGTEIISLTGSEYNILGFSFIISLIRFQVQADS